MCSGTSTVFICNVCVLFYWSRSFLKQFIIIPQRNAEIFAYRFFVFCSPITCDEDHSSPGKDMYGQINYSTFFFFFFTFRLQRNELSAEKSQLVQNGPVLHSTPFSHQSSLQQELEAQEVPTFKLLMSNSQLLLL